MSTPIPVFASINYTRPTSFAEKTLETLSNYFYLGGIKVTIVSKDNQVQLENGEVSWLIVALKVASYVLLFPLTLVLLATDIVLRNQYDFTVINSSNTPTPTQQTLSGTQSSTTPRTGPTETNPPSGQKLDQKHPETGQTLLASYSKDPEIKKGLLAIDSTTNNTPKSAQVDKQPYKLESPTSFSEFLAEKTQHFPEFTGKWDFTFNSAKKFHQQVNQPVVRLPGGHYGFYVFVEHVSLNESIKKEPVSNLYYAILDKKGEDFKIEGSCNALIYKYTGADEAPEENQNDSRSADEAPEENQEDLNNLDNFTLQDNPQISKSTSFPLYGNFYATKEMDSQIISPQMAQQFEEIEEQDKFSTEQEKKSILWLMYRLLNGLSVKIADQQSLFKEKPIKDPEGYWKIKLPVMSPLTPPKNPPTLFPTVNVAAETHVPPSSPKLDRSSPATSQEKQGLIATTIPVEQVRQVIIPTTSQKEIFHSFTIEVSRKALPPIIITSKEEMCLKVQEMGQQVKDQHLAIDIIIPYISIFSKYEEKQTTESEIKQVKEFLEKLKSIVDVLPTKSEDIFRIVPKKTVEVKDDHTVRTYDNGVTEEVYSSKEGKELNGWTTWGGRRTYPNGVIEEGHFNQFKLESGERKEKERTIYFRPDILVSKTGQDGSIICIAVKEQPQLIVVDKKPNSHEFAYEYVQAKKELIPTLTEILKRESDVYEKDLTEIFSENWINFEEFITYLFETNAIFSLKPSPLKILLKTIQEKKLVVNLHQQHPKTGETLLDCYSKDVKVIENLLAIDPTLIQRNEGSEIAFVRALLSKNQKGATLLLNHMEKQNMPLLPRELLFKKLAFSEGQVTTQELKSLSEEDQRIIFKLANIYSELNLIRTMKALGFGRTEELLMREGPSIFGCNADAVEMNNRLQCFIDELHSKKLILTKQEFNKHPKENYIEKGNDIGRILGRDYIEKKVHELNLEHVKVPKKIMVIPDNYTLIEFRIGEDLNIHARNVSVYAEKIKKSTREITSEEIAELIRLFEATGYTDIQWDNLIIAEDGVYIIDTEFDNFWLADFYFKNGRQYSEMTKIVSALPIEQQQTLIDELNIKMKTYQENEEKIVEQKRLRLETEQAALNQSGCIYGPRFLFPIKSSVIPKVIQ